MQWNREYIVNSFGIYTYQISDVLKCIEPSMASLFGSDKARKEINDYYDNNTVHKGGDRPYESSSSYYHIGGFQTELAAHHTLTVQLVSSGEKHPNASA